MTRIECRKELIKFLEDNRIVPVFSNALDMGYITSTEWKEAITYCEDEWFNTHDLLAMFILLAEGEDF